jgi:DNA-binding PadR family transcriptional regulator
MSCEGHPTGWEFWSVINFLELAILRLLMEREYHGYEIFTKIEEKFPNVTHFRNLVSRGIGYRTLRVLEAEGFISSAWEVGEGPGRRVYKIEDKGKEAFRALSKNFFESMDELQKMADFLREV